MPKHKYQDRPVEKTINIPASVLDRVNEQLNDPLTKKPPHGAWAKLLTALLIKWLNGEVKVTMPLRKKRQLDDFL